MPTLKKNQQLGHTDIHWDQRQFPLIVACDDWQDPRNVGMAFRLAESFGVSALWLGGITPAPPNRKLSKTARSTVERVPHYVIPDLQQRLLAAKEQGFARIGIEITSQSQPLRSVAHDWSNQSTILVLGAENAGIQPSILETLDACAHIPMYGQNTSLNVATALSIALYAWTENLL